MELLLAERLWTASVAVMVQEPAVLSRAVLRVATPLTRFTLPRLATRGSVVVRDAVPLKPPAVLSDGSFAVTVTVNAAPAATGLGVVTTKCNAGDVTVRFTAFAVLLEL